MYHVAGFLAVGVHAGLTDLLVSSSALGRALAETLADKPVVLMRGHGNVVVGPSVQVPSIGRSTPR
jgi:ribulose-5-phosphate 4-epimerase/fuculose-1-phosphate aldolase